VLRLCVAVFFLSLLFPCGVAFLQYIAFDTLTGQNEPGGTRGAFSLTWLYFSDVAFPWPSRLTRGPKSNPTDMGVACVARYERNAGIKVRGQHVD
jgi:hypothetical protein